MAVFRHAGLNGLNPRFHHKDDGQGNPRVMIYIYFVELQTLMLHAKFQESRPLVLEKIFKGFCYL